MSKKKASKSPAKRPAVGKLGAKGPGRPRKLAQRSDASGAAKLGRKLVELRGSRTVAQVAELSGLSLPTVYELESGRRAIPPKASTVTALDVALAAGGGLLRIYYSGLKSWKGGSRGGK